MDNESYFQGHISSLQGHFRSVQGHFKSVQGHFKSDIWSDIRKRHGKHDDRITIRGYPTVSLIGWNIDL